MACQGFILKEIMNRFFTIIFCFAVFSCGNGKDSTDTNSGSTSSTSGNSSNSANENSSTATNETESTEEKVDEDILVLGIVHTSETGCKLYIELENEDKDQLYPVNLEDKFKVDGLRLRFSFVYSKAQQPPDCLNVVIVSVDQVTAMR
jgi:hypothetical protein